MNNYSEQFDDLAIRAMLDALAASLPAPTAEDIAAIAAFEKGVL